MTEATAGEFAAEHEVGVRITEAGVEFTVNASQLNRLSRCAEPVTFGLADEYFAWHALPHIAAPLRNAMVAHVVEALRPIGGRLSLHTDSLVLHDATAGQLEVAKQLFAAGYTKAMRHEPVFI